MKILGLVVVVGCAQPVAKPAAPTTPPIAAQIDHIVHGLLPPVQVRGKAVRFTLDERMRKYRVPGVSIAVFDHYQLVWAKGFGLADVEAKTPVTETTLFQAGSISKSVNALAMLQAVARGKLALDTPINDSLKSWKLDDNELTRAAPVTLRRLLSHTAGTTIHGFPGYVAGTPVPTLVQLLSGEPPANSPKVIVDLLPGKQFRYSGGGISVAQLALVDQLDQPYPAILAADVLVPLGMTNSTYEQPLPPARVGQAAAGYGADGKGVPGKRNVYPEMAAAGLWTTPTDLARFFLALQRARAGKPEVVDKALAVEMTTGVASAIDGQVGLGVFLFDRNGARMFGHGGADTGFQADVVASLDHGYGLVVMANSDNGTRLFPEIERAVFAEYGWEGVDLPIERVPLDAARSDQLAGRYGFANLPVIVAVRDGALVVHQPFLDPHVLIPVAGDHFIADDGARITLNGSSFAQTGGGEVVELPRIPVATRVPLLELEAGRFDAAVAAATEDPRTVDEKQLNQYGYRVLADDHPAAAVEIFRFTAAVYPVSSNAEESLAEAYEAAGDKPHALASYEASLALVDRDPALSAAEREALRRLDREAASRLRAP